MEQVKEGMRVRVTLEGVVDYFSHDRESFSFKTDINRRHFISPNERSYVEILAPAPREWQDGAYYLNPNSGRVYQYDKGRDIFLNNEKEEFRFRHPVRDGFIKLVPEVES